MVTSPTTNVATTNSPVQLPALPLPAYRAIVATLQAAAPDNRDRIARGLNVLLTCDIFEASRTGEYLIQSCTERGTLYRTTGLFCSCPDAQRGHHCKHSAAVEILHAACAEASYDRAQARWLLTPRGEAALAAAR
jgi:hypothetical protein